MGLMDELKRLAHPYEDDEDMDDEYDDAPEVEEEYTAPRASRTEKAAPKASSAPAGSAAGGSYYESRTSRDSKVVNITSPNQMRVVLVEPNKPETNESMQEIADHLLAKHTIVLNLEKTDEVTSDHLLYFMGGVAYAVQGNMKRVAQNTYIIMPHNVDMEGELRDELENKGWMF